MNKIKTSEPKPLWKIMGMSTIERGIKNTETTL